MLAMDDGVGHMASVDVVEKQTMMMNGPGVSETAMHGTAMMATMGGTEEGSETATMNEEWHEEASTNVLVEDLCRLDIEVERPITKSAGSSGGKGKRNVTSVHSGSSDTCVGELRATALLTSEALTEA
ncbi:hypothetical protein PHYSODRAFT_344450 [Phytophthora sojae]|uniref:Uncharacterized protein n=1 Tax=Phytophthora sojae (strain P6497) TaxID=1094619 RepID=G4YTF4_PHYSP|nr:hypothetical protein PHYSODRAFT_344450 [Phytophthora sojae]EGZ23553.1 hypothetical protein PHYSODRAFT_344450 [Phytophthora sojae]|eukprot:XP_009518841.1 hypothetical protein PHYSODRAFT_344450 [Phytophthora sojae]